MYLVCVLLAWCAPTNLNAVRFQTHIFRGFLMHLIEPYYTVASQSYDTETAPLHEIQYCIQIMYCRCAPVLHTVRSDSVLKTYSQCTM